MYRVFKFSKSGKFITAMPGDYDSEMDAGLSAEKYRSGDEHQNHYEVHPASLIPEDKKGWYT
jgi:hypothetical protein